MTYSILYASPHAPLGAQREELTRLYGLYELTIIRQWDNVTDLMARFLDLPEPRELVLVAPLSVCREVIKRGIKPLSHRTITMDRHYILEPSCEWMHKGRVLRFIRFERRVSVVETFCPVEPVDAGDLAEQRAREEAHQ